MITASKTGKAVTTWWIGCSGFHYKEWKEVFYPSNIPQTKWFEHYCRHFNTLELNTTFYRFPRPDALLKWHDRSPDNFRFSVKAPQLITHYKNFKECERMLGDFYASIYEGLKDKLGCVLFQLPARVPYSDDLLQRIVDVLDPSFNNVVEFRDMSWWTQNVYRKLKKSRVSFCGISHPELADEVIRNTALLYYRFHGVPILYKSQYPDSFVKKIAEDIRSCGRVTEAYIYFNNTWGMGGINNATLMQQFLT